MKGTVITNAGIQLLVKLAASGNTLEFSRAAVGTGRIPSGYDPQNMLELNAYKKEAVIASTSALGDTATIVVQLSSEGVTEGFTVTEAAVYATDPDKGEILYSYLDMTEDPQYVYAAGAEITKFIEMTLNVVILSAVSVTAYINPNALIKRDEFEQELEKKTDAQGGDISDTVIAAHPAPPVDFPSLEESETAGGFFTKVKKFIDDFRVLKASIITVAQLANSGQVTMPGFALDARYGKTLADKDANLQNQIAQLNSDLVATNSNVNTKANAADLTALRSDLSWGDFPGTSLTDLNSIRPNGKFAIGTYSITATGNPAAGNSGGFMAFGAGGSVVQTAWMHSGIYARRYTSGAWGSWDKVLSL